MNNVLIPISKTIVQAVVLNSVYATYLAQVLAALQAVQAAGGVIFHIENYYASPSYQMRIYYYV